MTTATLTFSTNTSPAITDRIRLPLDDSGFIFDSSLLLNLDTLSSAVLVSTEFSFLFQVFCDELTRDMLDGVISIDFTNDKLVVDESMFQDSAGYEELRFGFPLFFDPAVRLAKVIVADRLKYIKRDQDILAQVKSGHGDYTGLSDFAFASSLPSH